MAKKPFIHPKIALIATIKQLRKELKYSKNEHRKLLGKYAKLKGKLKEQNDDLW